MCRDLLIHTSKLITVSVLSSCLIAKILVLWFTSLTLSFNIWSLRDSFKLLNDIRLSGWTPSLPQHDLTYILRCSYQDFYGDEFFKSLLMLLCYAVPLGDKDFPFFFFFFSYDLIFTLFIFSEKEKHHLINHLRVIPLCFWEKLLFYMSFFATS